MADRTFSLHDFGESPQPAPAFPATLASVGYEIRDEATYRWNNERHAAMGGHVFQYCLSGCGYYLHWPEGKKTLERIAPGQAFLASHDRAFEYYCSGTEPWEFVWVIVRGDYADRVCAELRDPSPVFRLAPESPPVVLLRNFLNRLDGPFVLDQYSVTAIAYDFLVQLLKTKRDGELGAEDRFPRAVRDFIVKNLKTVGVDVLARKFGYSPKYFIAYFHDRMHTTPHRYILWQKVRYASLLLVNTKKSVGEIALDVGFSEDNYFSKVFRRAMGQSPTAYRERHRDAFSVDDIIVL